MLPPLAGSPNRSSTRKNPKSNKLLAHVFSVVGLPFFFCFSFLFAMCALSLFVLFLWLLFMFFINFFDTFPVSHFGLTAFSRREGGMSANSLKTMAWLVTFCQQPRTWTKRKQLLKKCAHAQRSNDLRWHRRGRIVIMLRKPQPPDPLKSAIPQS